MITHLRSNCPVSWREDALLAFDDDEMRVVFFEAERLSAGAADAPLSAQHKPMHEATNRVRTTSTP
jgi:hypothetical protein